MRPCCACVAALVKAREGTGARRGRPNSEVTGRTRRVMIDLRRLDWNAYGRLGRFFMREYEHERTEHVTVLLDCSRSMAAGDPPKHLLARRAAAAFGYLALKRGGSATLAGQAAVEGVSRFSRFLDHLVAAEPTQDTGLHARAEALFARGRAPSDLVVISDALEPLESLQPLQAMSEKRTNLTLLQVLAPDELDPRPGDALELHGLEERESLELTLDAATIAAYQRELERHLEGIEGIARRHGWTLALTDSAADLRELFLGKLLPAGATP